MPDDDAAGSADMAPVAALTLLARPDLTPETAATRLARITPAGSPPPTSVTAASNEYLGRHIRGHREIESLLWLRDRNFREDESQAHRAGRLGPRPLTAPAPLRSGVLCDCSPSSQHRPQPEIVKYMLVLWSLDTIDWQWPPSGTAANAPTAKG